MTVRPLRGTVRVPSDKSLSHRVALFSAMAEGTSRVSNLLDSLDIHATLGAIEALGATVDLHKERNGLSGTITGWGSAGPRAPAAPLQCGNSGTTARLLLGILSGYNIIVGLRGDESLCRRPMGRVTQPLTLMGACFMSADACCACGNTEPSGLLPLSVKGSAQLKAIEYTSPVASAQVKSAILLAGLHANGTTRVTEPHKSRDHTELLLPAYGARMEIDGLTVSIPGGQQLHASDCRVPGDPSSAAFLLVGAALIPHSEVTVCDVLLNPTRTGFVEVMRRMGADIDVRHSEDGHLGGELVGAITVRYREQLQATVVKAGEIASLIDEVPILALLATVAEGETVFEQVGELRVKESDRLAAVIAGLRVLGFEAFEVGDDLHVRSGGFKAMGEIVAVFPSDDSDDRGTVLLSSDSMTREPSPCHPCHFVCPFVTISSPQSPDGSYRGISFGYC